ncbi:MAG: hypothetical protein WDN69_10025 [Aliidongia sp.]
MAAPDDENGWGSRILLLPALGAQGLYYFPFPASPPHVTADDRRRAADAAEAGAEQALGELTQHLVSWRRPVSFHSGGYHLGRTTASLFGEDAVAPAVSTAGSAPSAAPVDDEPSSSSSLAVVEPSWLKSDVPTVDRLAAESAKFGTRLDGLKKGSGRPVFAIAGNACDEAHISADGAACRSARGAVPGGTGKSLPADRG